jgi:hypothetical protein
MNKNLQGKVIVVTVGSRAFLVDSGVTAANRYGELAQMGF